MVCDHTCSPHSGKTKTINMLWGCAAVQPQHHAAQVWGLAHSVCPSSSHRWWRRGGGQDWVAKPSLSKWCLIRPGLKELKCVHCCRKLARQLVSFDPCSLIPLYTSRGNKQITQHMKKSEIKSVPALLVIVWTHIPRHSPQKPGVLRGDGAATKGSRAEIWGCSPAVKGKKARRGGSDDQTFLERQICHSKKNRAEKDRRRYAKNRDKVLGDRERQVCKPQPDFHSTPVLYSLSVCVSFKLKRHSSVFFSLLCNLSKSTWGFTGRGGGCFASVHSINFAIRNWPIPPASLWELLQIEKNNLLMHVGCCSVKPHHLRMLRVALRGPLSGLSTASTHATNAGTTLGWYCEGNHTDTQGTSLEKSMCNLWC